MDFFFIITFVHLVGASGMTTGGGNDECEGSGAGIEAMPKGCPLHALFPAAARVFNGHHGRPLMCREHARLTWLCPFSLQFYLVRRDEVKPTRSTAKYVR